MFINEIRINDVIEAVSVGMTMQMSYSTEIITTAAGRESRNGKRAEARRVWTFDPKNLDDEERENLISMFHVTRGALHSFRLKDWADYQTGGRVLGVADDLANGKFQLQVGYEFAGIRRLRAIKKPAPGTIKIYVDGVFDGGADVDHTTGIVTPVLQGAVTWTGEYDNEVRFELDDMHLTAIAIDPRQRKSFFETASISLIEVSTNA